MDILTSSLCFCYSLLFYQLLHSLIGYPLSHGIKIIILIGFLKNYIKQPRNKPCCCFSKMWRRFWLSSWWWEDCVECKFRWLKMTKRPLSICSRSSSSSNHIILLLLSSSYHSSYQLLLITRIRRKNIGQIICSHKNTISLKLGWQNS